MNVAGKSTKMSIHFIMQNPCFFSWWISMAPPKVKDYEAMRDDVPRTSKFQAAIQRRLKQQPQAESPWVTTTGESPWVCDATYKKPPGRCWSKARKANMEPASAISRKRISGTSYLPAFMFWICLCVKHVGMPTIHMKYRHWNPLKHLIVYIPHGWFIPIG